MATNASMPWFASGQQPSVAAYAHATEKRGQVHSGQTDSVSMTMEAGSAAARFGLLSCGTSRPAKARELAATPPVNESALTKWLPFVLSVIAGSVDVIGFLRLGGLFTAHVTGNLVILSARLLAGE